MWVTLHLRTGSPDLFGAKQFGHVHVHVMSVVAKPPGLGQVNVGFCKREP